MVHRHRGAGPDAHLRREEQAPPREPPLPNVAFSTLAIMRALPPVQDRQDPRLQGLLEFLHQALSAGGMSGFTRLVHQ